jgi:hypothetical protein
MKESGKYLFFFFFFGIACSTDKTNDPIPFDELAKPSNYSEKENPTTTNLKFNYLDSVSVFTRRIIDSLSFLDYTFEKLDSVFYIERFGIRSTEKWIAKGNQDSVSICVWNFKDSIQSKNAFFNWLDCFGQKCEAYKIGDKITFSRLNSVVLLTETSLVKLDSKKAIDKEKLNFTPDKPKSKSEKLIYFIEQKKGKKSSWFVKNTLDEDFVPMIK